MKEKLIKFQFLIYAVILFITASVLESYLSGLNSGGINVDRVESVLHRKEAGLDSAINFIKNEIESGENLVKENSVWVSSRDLTYLRRQGLTVLVYENDTLRFWTDNTAPADRLYSQSALNNRIANLNNAWYEIRMLNSGNLRYVGLIFIKNKYNINNKYLKNDFIPELNLPSSVQVSMIPLSYSFDIKDKEDKYIFSLVPTNSYDIDSNRVNIAGILFFMALLSLLVYVYSVVESLTNKEGNSLKIIAIISGVVITAFIMLIFRFPFNVYSLDFFDPVYFSGPGIFRTIGDFILNVSFMFAVVVYIFKLAEYKRINEKINEMPDSKFLTVWFIVLGAVFLVFGYLYHAAKLLVKESKISFQLTNVISLDIFSYSGILIMIILVGIMIYVLMQLTGYFRYSIIKDFNKTLIIFALVTILLFIITVLIADYKIAFVFLFFMLLTGSAMLTHYHKAEKSVYRYIFMVFLSAVFSCFLITVTTEEKLTEDSKKFVTYPSDEHDQIAELLLNDISEKLPNDGMISDFLRKTDRQVGEIKLRDYIQRQYFNGYWSKYNLSIDILEFAQGELFSNSDSEFAKTVNELATEVNGTGFYFVDKPDGTISYLAPLRFSVQDKICYVCISLDLKPVPQELGYPELLMDKNVKPSVISGYDYAKYCKGRKVSQNGEFSYDFSDEVFIGAFDQDTDTIAVTRLADYVHTVYRNGENTVVISRKSVSLLEIVTCFAYLFIIYIFVMLLVVIIRLIVMHNTDYRYQIKTRLIFSVTFILMLSFVLICVGSIYLNIRTFRENNAQSIDEKVKSVYMELEHTCSDTTKFHSVWNPNENSAMDEYLITLSHIFFIDINLYGADGELVATSRPEIFKQGLISTRLNTRVLQEFVIESKSNYTQEEKIGKMTYASAYIPFYNSSDELAAYINLPYFTKPEVLQKELGTLIVSIVNFYVILMMISIVIAVIISERIVHPIKLIQNKLEKIELGKQHEKIEYGRKDELGQLVAEYNSMAEKLEESAKLLAQGERESAWREMAKQIAHEIKNPLTPMKLSIQFLMRSKENNDADFDKKLEKVSNTLIQQIDTLSSIATGFSNFAKMPKPNEHPFNVIETLSNVIQLFNNVDNIDITSDLGGYEDITIVADKEQISRVFINLIKNATQAIPEGIRGKIHVSLEKQDKLIIKISDNGCGIPDEIRGKLFTPSFTTKSSGSGLGLAMVKNIIINAKGNITFESEVGKGTTFIVTLPL